MAPEEPPRASTVRHLRKMMAAAAALGVAAVTTRSASGRSETRDVSITPDASRPDTGAIDGGPDADPCGPNGPNAYGPQCGYMVVDPIPPPATRGCGCSKTPGEG